MYARYPFAVLRADGVSFPLDPANRDYAAYLQWIALGNTPDDPIEVAAPVPAVVTMRQAQIALLRAGYLDSIESALQAVEGLPGREARIEWDKGGVVERASPIVAMLAAALSLTTQVVTLFLPKRQGYKNAPPSDRYQH